MMVGKYNGDMCLYKPLFRRVCAVVDSLDHLTAADFFLKLCRNTQRKSEIERKTFGEVLF